VNDSLVLDIGGQIGALVIHTGPELVDTEIELSPIGADDARIHNVVHPRRIPGGTRHSAVFPDVVEGTYTVWRDPTSKHGTVTVQGGQVSDYDWS
jgi:hypothetical protein